MKASILVGHVLDRLKDIPDGSVQTCVTSPPYWGLRSYSTEPKIWGGDPLCDHEWVEWIKPAAEGTLTLDGNSALRAGHQGSVSATMRPTISNFCNICGAWKGELGLEPTPQLFVEHIVLVFREVKRVLRDDGVIWINLGDSYTGSGKGGNPEAGKQATNKGSQTVGVLYGKTGDQQMEVAQTNVTRNYDAIPPKNLVGIPWRVAFALQDDGWILRSEIIWSKPNPMPESVEDRPTKAHEQIFLLSKSPRYFYDHEAVKEDAAFPEMTHKSSRKSESQEEAYFGNAPTNLGRCGTLEGKRNKRSVWEVVTQPYPESHFATFPEALIEPCILAGTSEHGACPECGSPWKRITNSPKPPDEVYTETRNPCDEMVGRTSRKGGNGQAYQNWKSENPTQTIKWEPTCKCVSDKPLKPCLVLDPFCGSGTTGVVSLRYHRDFVGCELNPEYASMAERRIGNEAPMFNEVEVI
jgi:DNA modification methylase